MNVRVGCEFVYDTEWPTPTVMQVQPHVDGQCRMLTQTWDTDPSLPVHEFHDIYGNTCRRFTMPGGPLTVTYDAVVEVADDVDPYEPEAPQVPVEDLPDDTLLYTFPSRYCLSDVLSDVTWDLFGSVDGGWARVQAICDWVHDSVRFQYGTSSPMTTAVDIYEQRVGVCRDLTHLGVTFCRAMNIPARYVFGYLPDIDVPDPGTPMDFCAWFEAYLGDRWWTFDPRNNERRKGRVLIGRGRDALDVAMATTYGSHMLRSMTVWSGRATEGACAGAALDPSSS